VILVATIVFWSYALDWLGYQFPKFEQLMSPPPLLLVDHGKLIRRNMRQELITVDKLMTALREEGVTALQEVRWAHMEPDGRISVIRRDPA